MTWECANTRIIAWPTPDRMIHVLIGMDCSRAVLFRSRDNLGLETPAVQRQLGVRRRKNL